MGSVDHPFNPISVALGAEATFVGRALDSDRKGLTEVLRQAAAHRGASLVEIFQDCPIFNDGSFDVLRKGDDVAERLIKLVDGEPITFGNDGEYGVVRSASGGLEVAKVGGPDGVAEDDVVIHRPAEEDPTQSFALSRLSDQDLTHTVTGIFRKVDRPTYDDGARAQVEAAKEQAATRGDSLDALLRGKDTWAVMPEPENEQ